MSRTASHPASREIPPRDVKKKKKKRKVFIGRRMGQGVTSKGKERIVSGQEIFFRGKGLAGFLSAYDLCGVDQEISDHLLKSHIPGLD